MSERGLFAGALHSLNRVSIVLYVRHRLLHVSSQLVIQYIKTVREWGWTTATVDMNRTGYGILFFLVIWPTFIASRLSDQVPLNYPGEGKSPIGLQ
jgi:hypothetical protein